MHACIKGIQKKDKRSSCYPYQPMFILSVAFLNLFLLLVVCLFACFLTSFGFLSPQTRLWCFSILWRPKSHQDEVAIADLYWPQLTSKQGSEHPWFPRVKSPSYFKYPVLTWSCLCISCGVHICPALIVYGVLEVSIWRVHLPSLLKVDTRTTNL